MPTHPCYNCGEPCSCGVDSDDIKKDDDGNLLETPKGCWGCYDCYAEQKEREAQEEIQDEEN